jgi:hypothetical protein
MEVHSCCCEDPDGLLGGIMGRFCLRLTMGFPPTTIGLSSSNNAWIQQKNNLQEFWKRPQRVFETFHASSIHAQKLSSCIELLTDGITTTTTTTTHSSTADHPEQQQWDTHFRLTNSLCTFNFACMSG